MLTGDAEADAPARLRQAHYEAVDHAPTPLKMPEPGALGLLVDQGYLNTPVACTKAGMQSLVTFFGAAGAGGPWTTFDTGVSAHRRTTAYTSPYSAAVDYGVGFATCNQYNGNPSAVIGLTLFFANSQDLSGNLIWQVATSAVVQTGKTFVVLSYSQEKTGWFPVIAPNGAHAMYSMYLGRYGH